tara:strand:+ start:722 stop:991 length:270 start_codon:yes stop_codon:yes gene_type:complete
MLAATGAKFYATKSIARMKFQIGQQQQLNGEAKGRLKGAENKKKVLEQNRNMLSKKRNKLSGRLAALTAELSELENEETARLKEQNENE